MPWLWASQNVAADQAEDAFQIHRRQHLPSEHGILETRRIFVDRRDHQVRDFVAMMVPHHQGAIDMAQLVLQYGRNEQIRRLAQEIIVTQQQEIAAMYLAIGAPLPPPSPAPTKPANATPHHHSPQTAKP